MIKLLSMTPNYMEVMLEAAGQCYQKRLTTKAIEHIIKSGHLSILEHCYATFMIECSISTLLQLTRHRHLSFTVQSSRGSQLSNVHTVHDTFIDTLNEYVMRKYRELVMNGCENEKAAYVLPKAAKYKLVVTGNFRAWFEYLPKRLCKRAQEEHRILAHDIYCKLSQDAPEIFDRPMMGCEHCTESRCAFKLGKVDK